MTSKLSPLLIFASILLLSCEPSEKVDLIVHNAKVYTVNSAFSTEEAFAVKAGKIIAIGAEHEIRNKYLSDNYLDAKKRPIFPGFIDAHCHFISYALNLQKANLVGTKSYQEVINKVVEYATNNPDDDWIIGRGWDQNDWDVKEYPTKEKLDSIFPDKPVYLTRIDGHAVLLNQKAIDLIGFTTSTQINGGIIEQKNGLLTGIIIDNAVDAAFKLVPKPNNKQIEKALTNAQHNLFEVGLTTVDDAGLDRNQIEIIDKLQQNKTLLMKVYAMISGTPELLDYYLNKGPIKTEKLNVSSFKFYADGALGSRGACLLNPYSDILEKEHYGLILTEKEFLEEKAQLLYDKGFQMNTHCIGDSANRMLLNIYAKTLKGTNDKRWRIEHCQVIDSNDYQFFSNYNIIPSVQPTHATSDMYWAESRLGHHRVKHAYAYKELLQQNGLIALGTDFPIEGISPLHTFYAAVSRKDKDNYPENGFQVENALTREEALKGMTIWAAISSFEENEKGSLEIGKSADFVLLDNDIMSCKENELLSTQVLETYINGEQVYLRE